MRILLVFLLFSLAVSNTGEAEDKFTVIPPGLTYKNIDGEGKPELIVRGRRDNHNAHSGSIISFYRQEPSKHLILIPVEDKDRTGFSHAMETFEGAECTITDYRLVKAGKNRMHLLEGRREVTHSLHEDNTVRFRLFKLHHNEDGLPGFPDLYFKPQREWTSQGQYCDVNQAFEIEAMN